MGPIIHFSLHCFSSFTVFARAVVVIQSMLLPQLPKQHQGNRNERKWKQLADGKFWGYSTLMLHGIEHANATAHYSEKDFVHFFCPFHCLRQIQFTRENGHPFSAIKPSSASIYFTLDLMEHNMRQPPSVLGHNQVIAAFHTTWYAKWLITLFQLKRLIWNFWILFWVAIW